ncbi:MAG: lysine transporter LysE [Proteobacteria bacterium]|nr:MAG: lysine transporter LysE [Pseudomonadota bacterium]
MDLDNYLAYVAISFFTITSPGAAILLAINNAMMYSLRATFLSTLGNIIGLFILSSIAFFWIGAIVGIWEYFFVFLKIAGALYLVFLGLKQIFNKNLHFQVNPSKKAMFSSSEVFKKGFLVAITNPKAILFFSAIFPLFLQKNSSLTLQFFIMTFTFMAISFSSLMFYGALSKYTKLWFFNERKTSIFYKISGLLFILMGICMLFV